MSHKKTEKPIKAVNPEERLQASVARDIKIRTMQEHSKKQADALSVARWEAALYEKDQRARLQRMHDQLNKDSISNKVVSNTTRREQLQELYYNDELRYESELNMKGLAFTKDRV